MTLDQLIEKSQMIRYITFRSNKLINEFDFETIPPNQRQYQVERLEGRIMELQQLKEIICENRFDEVTNSMEKFHSKKNKKRLHR